MQVAGIDGYRYGWVIALCNALADGLRLNTVVTAASFSDVVSLTVNCVATGIDIPIGLSENDRRRADVEARRLLGGARASSVFPSPVRPALYTASYREACDVSKACCGRMISKQTYLLIPKVREVNEAMTVELQKRVCEVHPEVSFRELNGGITIPFSKHTRDGLAMRDGLLETIYGESISQRPLPTFATRDDLYDACAAAWTAWRIATDEAERIPQKPEVDARGLRMEIVY